MRAIHFLSAGLAAIGAIAGLWASAGPAPAQPVAHMDWRTGATFISRSGKPLDQSVPPPQPFPLEAAAAAAILIDPLATTALAETAVLPGKVRLDAGAYRVEFTPQASLRLAPFGRQALAGAVLRVGPISQRERRREIWGFGGAPGDRSLANTGRWHVFVALDKRMVSWREVRATNNAMRLGVSGDNSSATVTAGQVGFAWRAGPALAGMSYAQRKTTLGGPFPHAYPGNDSVVSLSLSLRPASAQAEP